MSKLNILPFFYQTIIKVSKLQVSMWQDTKEKHASITNQSLKKQVVRDLTGFQENKRNFFT